MERKELNEEEIEWNRGIGKSGLIVGAVGILAILGGAYLSAGHQEGFDKVNRDAYDAASKIVRGDFESGGKLYLIHQ